MKHLLNIGDLSADEIIGLMDEADRFREALSDREVKKLPTLRGRTIIRRVPVPPLKPLVSG